MQLWPGYETGSMEDVSDDGRPRHVPIKVFELRRFDVDVGAHMELVMYILD